MAVRHVEHGGLGLSFDLPHLRQRDVDAWYAALRVFAPDWRRYSDAERAGAFAKAAATCKWLPPEWTPQAIDDCDTPGLVRWIGLQIDAHVGAFITIPPNLKGPSPTT